MDVLRPNNNKTRSHLRWLSHLIVKAPERTEDIVGIYVETLEGIGGDSQLICFLHILKASICARGLGGTLEAWREKGGVMGFFVQEIERRRGE